jgi:Protein of unknown function (DUF3306)
MSDESEAFLARWSKRKSQARIGEHASETAREPKAVAETSSDGLRPVGVQDDGTDEIALENLPPIDSIDASTDLAQWLRKKVPEAWRQAALRRIWAADPAISQFIGLAENAWDWNVPGGVPGFGPLRPTDDVAQLVAQVIGKAPGGDKPEGPELAVEASESSRPELSRPDQIQPAAAEDGADVTSIDERLMPGSEASENDRPCASAEELQRIRRRRGGGALPS